MAARRTSSLSDSAASTDAAGSCDAAALIDSATDAVISKTPNGRITGWNRSAERLFGFTAAEMLGQPILRIIPPELHAEALRILTNVGRGEQVPSFDTERVRKDGTRVPVSLSVSPIRDAAGKVVGASKIAREITRRGNIAEQLRRSEQHYRSLVEATGALAWACPPSGLHVEAQPMWMAFTGQTAEEMLGSGWTAAIHPDDLATATTRWNEAVERGLPFRNEHRIRRHDGSWRWMSVHAVPIAGATGQIVEWSGMSFDVTDRKREHHALRERNRQLDLLARCSRLLLLEGQLTEPLLTTVFGEVAHSIGAEIYVNHQPHDAVSMRLRNWGGLTGDERPAFETIRYGELLCGRVAARRRPLIVEDIAHADVEGSDVMRAFGYGAYAGFPLLAGERLLGTIAFITRARTHFAEGEVQVLQSICDQVAAVLERERLTGELRESEQRIQQALKVSRSFTFQWEPATDSVRRSASCTDILHLEGDEAVNDTARRFFERIHVDDRAPFIATVSGLTPQAPGYRIEYRATRGDGDTVILEEIGHARFDAAGQMTRLVGVTTDITERKQADDALRIAGDSFRRLVEQSPFGIYAVDADFRLAMVSAGAQKVFATVRPLLGRDFAEVLHVVWPEPFASDAIAHFRHTLATGEPFHAPSTVEQRADIDAREAYDWKLERMVLPDGRPGVVCHFYDLSERQRYEETLRVARIRLETALDASPVALFQQDRALRYTWIHNPALGFASNDVVGKRDRDLFQRTEDADRTEAIKRSVIETGIARREEVCVVQDGLARYYDVVVQPDRDASGAIVGVNCAAVDVTARKEIEAQLRQTDRQKDEFLALLAHELRNPLAPIRNASAILARTRPHDPAVQEPLAVIERQTTHLTRLVDDLLDVSRIVGRRIDLKAELLEVGTILDQAAETIQPLINDKRHRLRVVRPQEKLFLRGDRTRLVQAVGNLLHNAAKYTDPAGDITLEVRASDDELDIAVSDTGVGIAAELLPRVFDVFVQSERALDRAQGGLGIGLSVVKGLIEMHGGTVRAHSDGVGRGSVLTLSLPRAPAPRPPSASRLPPSPSAPRRILLVDDNVDAVDSLAKLLRFDGHDVETAYGGVAALAAIEAHEPDVVLLDIGMPQMDGYEVARRVRARTGTAKRPRLVALTGYGQEVDRARAEAAGFDAHLVKPADLDTLTRVLAALDPAEPR